VQLCESRKQRYLWRAHSISTRQISPGLLRFLILDTFTLLVTCAWQVAHRSVQGVSNTFASSTYSTSEPIPNPRSKHKQPPKDEPRSHFSHTNMVHTNSTTNKPHGIE